MADTDVRFNGWPEMRAKVGKVDENAKEGGRRGLLLGCENVLGVATVHVPFENGDLSRDGAASVDDEKLIAAVVYGRDADTSKYAVRQHEDLTFKHDDGRTAKWLENAFNQEKDHSLQILGVQIQRATGMTK